MADCILIAFAIAAAWVLSLYLKPSGKCWPSGGRGNLHRKGVLPCPGRTRPHPIRDHLFLSRWF
jgi:hypothetical protein